MLPTALLSCMLENGHAWHSETAGLSWFVDCTRVVRPARSLRPVPSLMCVGRRDSGTDMQQALLLGYLSTILHGPFSLACTCSVGVSSHARAFSRLLDVIAIHTCGGAPCFLHKRRTALIL